VLARLAKKLDGHTFCLLSGDRYSSWSVYKWQAVVHGPAPWLLLLPWHPIPAIYKLGSGDEEFDIR
jgi:hypothetical protein